MTPDTIFAQAIAIDSAQQRDAFLDDSCKCDPALRREVEGLVRDYFRAGAFLERPAACLGVTTDAPVCERPGTVIGPYKLMEQIGEGGFGLVFVAEQQYPVRRRVALKVIKPGMDSRQVVARFEAERQALALMDHPNIARVHDGGATDSGRPYFVMELVKGAPITHFCDADRLTTRERLRLFVSVCSAVQHAHQKGVIHRDLKPSNVLVTSHDGTPVVKIIDFGVAKASGQQLTEKTVYTQFTQMVGTPLYMSPEQAGQSGLDIDTRTDIYSLGVLLYELLTGTTPFDEERLRTAGYDELRRIIREEEPARPSTRISTLGQAAATVSANRKIDPKGLSRLVRGELDWIVLKALEKDRNRRYETAGALAADVQRFLADEPVEACPPSAGYRFRKFAQRHKRGLITASLVAAAAMLTAAGSGGFIWQANQNLQQALDREQGGAYLQRIALAEREWAGNNLSRMEELLGQCPEKLRGWEWHYLKRLRYSTLSPLRHESPVLIAAFSPTDGKLLATGTKSGVITIWQSKNGQELRKWQAHTENAAAVVFSPDGRYLATGSWDGTVKLWDMETVLRHEVPPHLICLEPTRRVYSLAFRPDGQRLACGSGRSSQEKGELKVWDLGSRQEVLSLSHFSDTITCVQFSPDGRRLATTTRGSVQVWDAQTGREQLRLPHTDTRRMGVAFSPDGHHLATVGGHLSVHPDEEVKVWDANTGREVLSLKGHVGGLRGVAYSPDGLRLASTGLDQTVKLWDATTGQAVITLRGHIDNVFSVAFSPDGRRLASASIDKTVRIWDATPTEQELIPEYQTLRRHTGAVTHVAFHPTDARSLVSAGTDGTARLWDAGNGKELRILRATHSGKRTVVAFSPDGEKLAVGCTEPGQAVRVLEVATGKEICSIPGWNDGTLSLAFSPDGNHVAAGGMDWTVRVWDAKTAQEVRVLKNHTWPVFGMAISPDGRYLVSGSSDSTVRLWDWLTGQELRVLEPRHASRVAHVAYSRDGKQLASASWDRTVKVWDTTSWRLLYDLPCLSGIQCVAYDRDGPRLAWGGTDGTVRVWDGPDREPHTLRGHTSWVQSVAFSHDGKWIASASLDGTVKIWQAPPTPEAPAPEAGEQRNKAAARPGED
jgi:eukaryotic-like serine/threonine-protein kinase